MKTFFPQKPTRVNVNSLKKNTILKNKIERKKFNKQLF
jgi:hypothetical protein